MGLSYICLDFDGHHSGGSSFDLYIKYFLKLSDVGHTHRHQFGFKKKNQVKSPSPESRVPETG